MLYDIEFWRTVALAFAAVGQTLFVLLYLTFPWYATFMGKALFAKAFALLLITDLAALARVFDFLSNDALFVFLYGVLATTVWGQFIAFLIVKVESHRTKVSGNRVDLRD